MPSVETKRLQIRVTADVAAHLDALATKLGVSQSAVGSLLIVAGLGRFGDVVKDPKTLAAVVDALQEVKTGVE